MAATPSSRQRAYSTASATFLRRIPSFPLHTRLDDPYDALNAGVGGAEHIQVLFAHSNSKIVNFTFSAATIKNGEPLPWRSPSERTIASGPLRIYKTVPHNVAFLQSGSALKPLLSKTQCWNVDGKNIFCLQLRPGNYWRVEIMGFEVEQIAKSAEFHSAMSKIIALEVTACPFVRAVDCAPVTESPTVLLPAKVWRRPALRKITPFKGPDAKAQSELENSEEMDEMGDHVVDLDKPVPVLHHAISFGDRWDDIGRLSTDISARRGRDESPSPTVFQQRRAKYESSIERRHPVSDHFSQAPVQGNQTSLRDRRRSSFGGERIFRRWNPDTSGDVMPGSFTDLNQHSAHGGIQAPSILEDYGMEEFIEHSSPEGYGSTVPALAIKSSEMTPDDGFSSLDEYASSFDSEQWNGFSLTPPRNPFFAGTIDVTPRSLSPPVLDDATAFGEPSRPTTPVNGCPTATPTEWYTPTQHPLVRRKKRPEVPNTSIFLEPSTDTSNLTTPSLSSASSSESEAEPQETYTPPRPRSRVRPHDTQPKLRRVASSFSIAAATANFVILKPSAFLVAMMFSIAARIAARVVAGAAYSLAERGDLGLGWDVWDEADVDDYGLKPREERRLRKSDIEERRAWGLEE